MCVFGRALKDFIPIIPGHYQPHETWRDTLTLREAALLNTHQSRERLWEHAQRLPPLSVGDFVRIQNHTEPHPLKWDKTGRVVEVRQFDQYVVHVDGSGRVTVRNSKFLRKYSPVYLPPAKHTIGFNLQPPSSASKFAPAAPAKQTPSAPCVKPVDIPLTRLTLEIPTYSSDQRDPPLMNAPAMTPPVTPTPDIPPPGTSVHVDTPPIDVPVTTPRQPPQQGQCLSYVIPRRSTRPRVEPT